MERDPSIVASFPYANAHQCQTGRDRIVPEWHDVDSRADPVTMRPDSSVVAIRSR